MLHLLFSLGHKSNRFVSFFQLFSHYFCVDFGSVIIFHLPSIGYILLKSVFHLFAMITSKSNSSDAGFSSTFL